MKKASLLTLRIKMAKNNQQNLFQKAITTITSFFGSLLDTIRRFFNKNSKGSGSLIPNNPYAPPGVTSNMCDWVYFNNQSERIDGQIKVLEEIHNKEVDKDIRDTAQKLLEKRKATRDNFLHKRDTLLGGNSRTVLKPTPLVTFSEDAPSATRTCSLSRQIAILGLIHHESQQTKDTELEELSLKLLHATETIRAKLLGEKHALGTDLSPVAALKKLNKELMEKMQSIVNEMLKFSPKLKKNDKIFEKFNECQNEEKRTPNPDLRMLGIWAIQRKEEAECLERMHDNLKRTGRCTLK